MPQKGLDSFWNGVRYPNGFGLGINLGYDEIVPGFYIPTDTDPTLSGRHAEAYSAVVDGHDTAATVQAINRVSRNLTAAGVPGVVEQTLLSLEKIAITVQQARVFVRARNGVRHPDRHLERHVGWGRRKSGGGWIHRSAKGDRRRSG